MNFCSQLLENISPYVYALSGRAGLNAQELEAARCNGRAIYHAQKPARQASIAKLYKDKSLLANEHQSQLFETTTTGWSRQNKIVFVQILTSNLTKQHEEDDSDLFSRPLSSAWIKKFAQGADMSAMIKEGLITRHDHVNKGLLGKGKCARYQISTDWLCEWTTLGATRLPTLNVSSAIVGDKGENHTGESFALHEYENYLIINRQVFEIWKQEWAVAEQMPPSVSRKKLIQKLAGDKRCLDTIDSKGVPARPCDLAGKPYVGSYLKYKQTCRILDEGCRMYEIGGGIMNLSKDLRAIALSETGQSTYDIEKCHATIIHNELEKLFPGKSALTLFIQGKLPDLGIDPSTLKIAHLMVIYGCSLIRFNKKIPPFYQLILEDPQFKARFKYAPYKQKQAAIEKLALYFKPLQVQLRSLSKSIAIANPELKSKKPATRLSVFSQRIEQAAIARFAPGIAANQHDGFISSELIPPQSIGYSTHSGNHTLRLTIKLTPTQVQRLPLLVYSNTTDSRDNYNTKGCLR